MTAAICSTKEDLDEGSRLVIGSSREVVEMVKTEDSNLETQVLDLAGIMAFTISTC